eukprot:Skav227857  [mRNA]  locus=scaffold383:140180:145949:+ [translate_table: standard]
MNLSAPFIVQVPPFRAVIEKTLPLCSDYLFGNETEAQAYAEAVGWDTQARGGALLPRGRPRPWSLPGTGNKPYRKVVITQGSEPTVVAIRVTSPHQELMTSSVPHQEKLVDTNGAGDAFVGGFLAALAKGKDMEATVQPMSR